MTDLTIKRGATFRALARRKDDAGAPFDLTATVITSTVAGGGFFYDLTITKDVEIGAFYLTAETSTWPLGTLDWDIEYVDGSVVRKVPGGFNWRIRVVEGPTS